MGAIILFAGLPMVLIPLFLLRWEQRVNMRFAASADWPKAMATITASELGGRAQRAYPVVRYRYEHAGKTYDGNRIGFVSVSRGEETSASVLARYPLGAQVEAFVDPARPDFAILERHADTATLRSAAWWLGGAFGLVFVILVLDQLTS